MIKSMTGFGKSVLELPNRKVTIEIKTLNSKQIDISSRISGFYKNRELELRSLLSKKLQRGKIDLNIFVETSEESNKFTLNHQLAKKYYEELKQISNEIEERNFSDYLPIIVNMPDVLVPEIDEIDETEWKQILLKTEEAINEVDEFRRNEGEILQQDFIKRISLINDFLLEIEKHESSRIEDFKKRIKKELLDAIEESKIDNNRFEQELIYYIERFDITEEKIRLKKHLDFFTITLNENISNGKKLIFISQEIGREINTIGSKANNATIQKIVVNMKDELEKIKEQLFNVL
ncbi:MAG: YicC family protein [Bacteroidales bacterium]|nr:YicC family protein [Bacteroidales bacterium]